MKTTFRTLTLALISLFTFNAAFAGNDRPIQISELPAEAQATLTKHFPKAQVALATYDNELLDKSYNVILTDGTKIEFGASGQWNEIKCKTTTVPMSLIPAQIAQYIKQNHSGKQVRSIEIDRNRYDVELTGDVELTFNKKFKVIDIDF